MTTNDAAIDTTDGIDLLLQPWRHLAAQLSPLIGERGFCALHGRAVRLASVRFGWLTPVQPGKSIDGLLVAMRMLYAAADHAEATHANEAILLTFSKLLTGLIGGALTMQLLDAAPAGGTACKPVQEQQ